MTEYPTTTTVSAPTRAPERDDLTHHLLARATAGELTRRPNGQDYLLGRVTLDLESVLALSVLNRHALLLWLPVWGVGGGYAVPTSRGLALLAEWDDRRFGVAA